MIRTSSKINASITHQSIITWLDTSMYNIKRISMNIYVSLKFQTIQPQMAHFNFENKPVLAFEWAYQKSIYLWKDFYNTNPYENYETCITISLTISITISLTIRLTIYVIEFVLHIYSL